MKRIGGPRMCVFGMLDWGSLILGGGLVAIIGALSAAYVRIRRAKDSSKEVDHKIQTDTRKTTLSEAFELIQTLQQDAAERRADVRRLTETEGICQRRLARAEQWIESAVTLFGIHKIPHPPWVPLSLMDGSNTHAVPDQLWEDKK